MNTIKQANCNKHNEYITKQMDIMLKDEAALYASIQKLAVMVLYHAMRYKDNSGANIMINKLGKGVRKQGLVNWFVTYGGFKFDNVLSEFTTDFDADLIHTKIKLAKSKPWHKEVAKERLTKPWDANDELIKFINNFNNHKKKMDKMSDEDKAKMNFIIKGEVIQNLLKMVDFEAILIEDEIEKLEEHLNVA